MVFGASLLCSFLFVGMALLVVQAGNIGWNALSETWHFIFYAEGIVFVVQIALIILFSLINHSAMEKFSAFLELLFSYKMAVDPFIILLMFAKDHGVYDYYLPVVHNILQVGFFMNILLVCLIIYYIKKESNEISFLSIIKFMITLAVPVILAILFLIRIIIKSEILYIGDLGDILLVVTVIFICVLIGNLFYVIEPYHIISESTFFNPPTPQRIYVKRTKKKKRKKRKG